MRRHPGNPLLIALLIASTSSFAGDDPPLGRDDLRLREDLRVRRVHLPVVVDADRGAAGRCAGLSPAELRVFEDGEPRRVTAVGPRPLPRTHALLIDTSRSMLDDLDEAKQAAMHYIESLPPDDAVLLASFDESLVLHAAPTTDRAVLHDGIERLRSGYATALWDALYYMLRYLEGQPGEKIVILITDGEDSHSLEVHRRRAFELARSTPDLTLFVVGLDLPAALSRGLPMARGRLGEISRRNGGQLFEIRSVSVLPSIFRRVQARLEERVYVSYIPLELGGAPRDRREDGDGRWRKVRVRCADDVPCAVRALGPTDLYARCPGLPVDAEIDGVHRFGPGGDDPVLLTLRTRSALLGRATDLSVERGPLFLGRAGRKSQKISLDRKPVFTVRSFAMATTPCRRASRPAQRPRGRVALHARAGLLRARTHAGRALPSGAVSDSRTDVPGAAATLRAVVARGLPRLPRLVSRVRRGARRNAAGRTATRSTGRARPRHGGRGDVARGSR